MTLTDGLKKAIDILTGGFIEDDNGDDIGSVIDGLNGGYSEIEDGNAIRKPMYEPEIAKSFKEKVTRMPVTKPSDHKIVIVEPRSFGEAKQLVEHLRERKTVMLNLHLLDKEQSQRTIDFVCGAVHALDGTPRQVGDMTFVFAPHNVSLASETLTNPNKFGNEMWGTKQF